jgi:type II secretory ATPase GspE/PulE/Tfp pilus assembly ATPase PilB-like protein
VLLQGALRQRPPACRNLKLALKTMFEDGLEKVELALTSIDEVLRAIRE